MGSSVLDRIDWIEQFPIVDVWATQKEAPMLPKILFADDDPLMHQLYKPHVERAGYEWIGARNGREAMEVAACGGTRLAVIDIMMPEMDGLATVTKLKNADATKTIPVILITGELQYYARQREISELGAAVFITKPFGPGQLLEAINRLLPKTANIP